MHFMQEQVTYRPAFLLIEVTSLCSTGTNFRQIGPGIVLILL